MKKAQMALYGLISPMKKAQMYIKKKDEQILSRY